MIIPDWMITQLCVGNALGIVETGMIRFKTMPKIVPMVAPFDPGLVNPASLDIRVGNTAKLRTQKVTGKVTIYQWEQFEDKWITPDGTLVKCAYIDIDLSKYSEEKPYWLLPNQRALIDSLETFNLPNFICAQFRLKSSRGREWYEHVEAGFCDPGWHGSKLTMEIINMDLNPLPIYTGLRMGQLIFSLMLAIPEKSYKETGRYNNDLTVMESKG
jgi:dCTP deaminase